MTIKRRLRPKPSPPWGEDNHSGSSQSSLAKVRCRDLFDSLGFKDFVAVFALCAGGEFQAFADEVKAFGKQGLVSVAHMVKRTHRGWPIGNENKIVAISVFDVFTQSAFSAGIEITFFSRVGVCNPYL